MDMNNGIRIRCFLPLHYCYIFADTEDYVSIRLFSAAGISVSHVKQMMKRGSPYRLIVCYVRKKDLDKFSDVLKRLRNNILLLGYKDYDEFCMSLKEAEAVLSAKKKRGSVKMENLTDRIVKYIKGTPEDINNWQKQGVLSTLADDAKKQELLLELCEIYFSFVMTRLRIGEEFKKEGKLALDSISNLDIYKDYSAGIINPATGIDHSKYKYSPLFKEITSAFSTRYHYFRLAQKNRLLSYEMLEQLRAPFSSCSYKGKRRHLPLELRMFFKHAEDFIFNEAMPAIVASYDEMKVLHPDWMPGSVSDDMVKKYYNDRTCAGIFRIIRKYWLDTAERWSEYNIQEGSYSVENRYIKINLYQKEAEEEANRIMDDTLRQMEAGQSVEKHKCFRPGHIMLLDNGLLLWALDKMNPFGLFIDECGRLLEPDIFDRRYVPEFSEIDPILRSLNETYDKFYNYLIRNTRAMRFKELNDHTCDIYGYDMKPYHKKDAVSSKLSGGDLAVKEKEDYSSMPQIFDMYLWKYRKDYYCGSSNDTFRYLCLPIDKQGFGDPKHSSIVLFHMGL